MARIIPIDDPDDPRVAAYRDLKDRDLRALAGEGAHGGHFVAEGPGAVRLLAASPLYRPASVLLAERRLAFMADAVDALPQETPVYAAAQPVLDAIAGFALHRGVLALGLRGAAREAKALLDGAGPQALAVVLVGLSDADNVGAAFRNAAAFGAAAVIVDAGCCDPLYRKAIRVSAGAVLRLPFARLERGENMVTLLKAAGFTPIALSPRGATALAQLARPPRAALIVGAEGEGLPNAVLADAESVSIPMAAGVDSLNVSTALGVALHHLAFVARRR